MFVCLQKLIVSLALCEVLGESLLLGRRAVLLTSADALYILTHLVQEQAGNFLVQKIK